MWLYGTLFHMNKYRKIQGLGQILPSVCMVRSIVKCAVYGLAERNWHQKVKNRGSFILLLLLVPLFYHCCCYYYFYHYIRKKLLLNKNLVLFSRVINTVRFYRRTIFDFHLAWCNNYCIPISLCPLFLPALQRLSFPFLALFFLFAFARRRRCNWAKRKCSVFCANTLFYLLDSGLG